MSQQSPFNLEKNIVIRACAGAGKTYRLTWRYIVILDNFAKLAKNTSEKNWLGPANILAITFTNKATAELRSRILKTLNSLLSNSISNLPVKIDNLVNSDLKYINWLKRQLLKPSIMTIDSFCTSIIKDYPNFSGVDSSVKIMDDYDSKEFYGQCFKQFFKTVNSSQIKFIALKLGAKNIQPIFIDALNNQSQLIKLISKYDLNENEILNFWMKNYQIDIDFSGIVQKTFNGAKLIIESELPIDIKSEWDELYEISKKILSSEKLEQNDLFRNNLIPLIITKGGKYKAKPAKTGNKNQWNNAGLEKSIIDDIILDWKHECSLINLEDIYTIVTSFDIEHARIIKTMLSHFENWFKFVDGKKTHKRVMNFKDLLIKSNQLLVDNPQIKNQISKNYHHIMVDEFQDTTHAHWKLIKLIFENDGRLKSNGLFLVGDEKQSIYRFNQADVTTFKKAIQDLKTVDPLFKPIELNWNFRSTENLINEGINPLFENIFVKENEGDSFTASHQETISHPDSENKLVPDEFDFKQKSMKIDLMYLSEEIKAKKNDLTYPKYLAKTVKKILDKNSNLKNNCIGILLRAVKPVISVYSEAFSKFGIKAEILASSSFYQSQEVMDIEMLISLILNPYDDIAFCGILKSPIFSLTDSEIHQMISERGKKSIFEFLEIQENSILVEIKQWIDDAKSIPIDRLVESIINSNHRELAFLSEPNGEQVWANINKLISILHNWSLAGDSIEKIRESLRGHIKNNESENHFKISSNTKVVIMSIHKSKGLSFPFVIIPEIQKKILSSHKSKMNIDFLIDNKGNRNIELAFSTRDENWENQNFGINQQLINQQNIENFEECKRILYVGLTRAKYGVILSGLINEKDLEKNVGTNFIDSKSWLNWLRKIYPIDQLILEFQEKIDIENGPEININYFENEDEILDKIELDTIDYIPKKIDKVNTKFYYLSVTQLFKNSNTEKIIDGNNFENSPERGSLIHKILEHGWINLKEDTSKIIQWIETQNSEFRDSVENLDIYEIILGLNQNTKILEIQNLPSENCFKELWVQANLESNSKNNQILLTGIIDVLYFENNQWYVLDYKTGCKSEQNEQYANQVQTYLHLVKHCFNIDAIGQIFYLDENIVEYIEFESKFLEKLSYDSQQNFKFISYVNSDEFVNSIESQNLKQQILVVANNRRKISVWNSLIQTKKMIPNIDIITFSDFKSKCKKNDLISAPTFIKRQLILKIFNFQLNEFDLLNLPGIVDKLWEAFEIYENSEEYLDRSLVERFNIYKREIENLGFTISNSNFDLDNDYLIEKSILIENPALVKNEDLIFFEKLSGTINITVFDDQIKFTENNRQKFINENISKESIKWMGFNSFQDEINYILNHIKLNLDNNFNDFTIVLPSMGKYLPKIAGYFRREGIPLSIRKSEPISESPIVKSAISLFNLGINNNLIWLDLKSFLESKLNEYTNFFPTITSENIYKIDLLIRKFGKNIDISNDLENLKFKTNDMSVIDDLYAISLQFNNLKNISLLEIMRELKFQCQNIINESDFLPLKEFLKLTGELSNQIEKYNFKLSDFQLLNEITHLHSKLEYSKRESDWGVEIISVMDSIKVKNKYIYIPGLNRDVFPVQLVNNPFIKNTSNHEVANLYIFDSWIIENKNLFLSYPIYNEKNEELDSTIFMDGINPEIILENVEIESQINNRKTIGKLIQLQNDSKKLGPIVKRHNAFLKEEIPKAYFGELDNYEIKPENNYLSATSLDEIFLKPYFYFLKREWNLFEIDYEENIGLDKGDFIHKVLEIFGNKNGWDLNRKNHLKAIDLLKEISKDYLKKYNGTFKLNIEELFWTFPTIFEKLLEEEIEKVPGMKHYLTESNFGNNEEYELSQISISHPKIGDLFFKGKIDRVDISKDEKQILIQDFKTGNLKWNSLNGDMSRQLFIYYLVLKNKFPSGSISATYREIKDINNFGYNSGFIIEDSLQDFPELKIKKSKRHIIISDIEEIFKQILNCFQPIVDSNFPLFSKFNIKINLDSYYYLKAVSRLESIKFTLLNN